MERVLPAPVLALSLGWPCLGARDARATESLWQLAAADKGELSAEERVRRLERRLKRQKQELEEKEAAQPAPVDPDAPPNKWSLKRERRDEEEAAPASKPAPRPAVKAVPAKPAPKPAPVPAQPAPGPVEATAPTAPQGLTPVPPPPPRPDDAAIVTGATAEQAVAPPAEEPALPDEMGVRDKAAVPRPVSDIRITAPAGSATEQAASIRPGDTVTAANVEKVAALIPPGVQWCVRNGMDMDIVPYKSVPVRDSYIQATEKYASEVELTPANTIINYVAGKPFPTIDPSDPDAAVKVMHNFQHSHYFTDSLDLHLVDADTGALYVDAKGNRSYQIERHFVPDWLRQMRFHGRIASAPDYELEPNKDQTWQKAGLYPLIEPFDLKGVGGVVFRYTDETRQDDTWLYLPLLRRVRRLSSAQRSDALFGQDIDIDSYGGYAGQIPWFDWKLLTIQPALQSLHGQNMPAKLCEGDGGLTFCEPWELRPEVYVIEGRSKQSTYAYSKRVIYVEKETNLISVSDLYDRNAELWKTVMLSFRVDRKPNPKVDFSYEDERIFIYAYTVVDIQLQHGTRVSIPGMAYQEEPGWYLDMPEDAPSSVDESWFSVTALIRAGR
jgi:hypothetical protein